MRRRRMPRVAAAAALLLLLRAIAGDTALFGDHPLGSFLALVTFLAAAVTIIYYVPKALVSKFAKIAGDIGVRGLA